MRAKFVFEKFVEDSDPISDLGISYSEKQAKRQFQSHAWRLLKFIKSKGEEGASFTEIQYFIWTELQKKDPKEFWKSADYSKYKTRASRGMWSTVLYGSWKYKGLLHRFCKKNPDTKKWVFVRYPRPGEIFYYGGEDYKRGNR